jgi:periplasmic protein TonB
MKNTKENLDDIIFEKRNKTYGAYMLRKVYSKNLLKAMLIAFILFLMGVSVPLIASYMNEVRYVPDNGDVVVVIGPIKDKPDIKLVDLPKLKPQNARIYRPPIVITNPNENDTELGELIDNTVNTYIGDSNAVNIDIPDVDTKTKIIDEDNEIRPLSGISEMPEFPGGDEARIKFLSQNLVYPRIAVETGIEGKVVLTFVVEKDGSIAHIKLLRGIGASCDEEAERVVALMPKWKPGRQNGREVRVQINLPIDFVLR